MVSVVSVIVILLLYSKSIRWRIESMATRHRERGDNRCDRSKFRPVPWVTQKLGAAQGPVIAVSDYMRAVQDQIRQWVPGDFASLGTDGYGFSDTRPAARRFFHIDGPSMAVRALQSLAERGEVDRSVPLEAARKYALGDVTAGSSGNEGGDS